MSDILTIKQCRRRKRIYNKLLKDIFNNDFGNLNLEEIAYIELALKRSIAIEILNIKELKKE